MSDETPMHVPFSFSVPKDKDDGFRHIVAEYGDARIHIDYYDDEKGNANLGKLVGSMPTVLEAVRQEILIKKEAAEVEQDLVDLLGEGESDA